MATRSTQFSPSTPAGPLSRPIMQAAQSQSPKGGVIIDLGSAQPTGVKWLGDGFDAGSSQTSAYERCLRGETARWPTGA